MNFSVKNDEIKFLCYNNNDDEELKNIIIVYCNKVYDNYKKILVFDDCNVKESAVLLDKNYCKIPKDIKGNLIGIKMILLNNDEQIETNRISVKRKEL